MVVGIGFVFDVAVAAAISKQPSDFPLLTAPPATQMSTIAQRLAAVNATQCGTFHIESDYLMSNPPNNANQPTHPKTIQVMTDSEFPLAAFLISDSGNCAMGDRSLADIFRGTGAPLRDCLRSRTQLRVDVRGDSYSVGDFTVNIGLASVGQQCRGCVAEIRYLPGVPIMQMDAWFLIFREFINVALCFKIPQEFLNPGFKMPQEFFNQQNLKKLLTTSMACCGINPNANTTQLTPAALTMCSAVFIMEQYAMVFASFRKPQETPAGQPTSNAPSSGQNEK